MSAADCEFDSYEWDDEKSEQTYNKNGIDFGTAARVFESEDGYVERADTRDYGEPRYIITGRVDDFVVTVVWTPRNRTRRIISAWPATRWEKRRYQSGHRKANGTGGSIE